MKYYVYQLVSSLDGAVFYIGKGSGTRMYDHERQAKGMKNSYKLNKIRKILRMGGKVEKRIIGLFTDESRAYEYESIQIKETPGLTNIQGSVYIKPIDTGIGRRMYAALIVASTWPLVGYPILLRLIRQHGELPLYREQAYMVKAYG